MRLNLIGTNLGPYELKELAGEGGMATVYKAHQTNLDRWVAVKVLHTHNPELLKRFDREAKAVAKLHHPNILPVYEYGRHDDWLYIVMELIEEGSLEDYLDVGPLDPIQVAQLSSALAEALHHAHGQGLIHRDIKPSNILMPREDWPLLADFGLVKVKEPTELITKSDMTLGTPGYMPPEQVMGKKVDLRADIYALGVMMFEMVTGRLPFEHRNLNMLMLAHVSKQPPRPRDLAPQCPYELEDIILKALRKSPDDRYQDMQALATALKSFIAGSVTLPLTAASQRPSKSRASAPRPAIPDKTQQIQANFQTNPLSPQLHLRDQNVSIKIPLPAPGQTELIIGRSRTDAPVDINLAPYQASEAGISRRHARLILKEDAWLLDDLGSTNGTYLNEIKLIPDAPVRLRHGDEIRFGLLACVFLSAPEV